jgi:hypothetical protein
MCLDKIKTTKINLDSTLFRKFFYSSSFFKYPSLYKQYKNNVGGLSFQIKNYETPFFTLYKTVVETKTQTEILWFDSKENVFFYSKKQK